MARPRKYQEKLDVSITVRLTTAEGAELRAKAAEANMSPAEYIRDYVMKEKTVVIARPKASLEKKRMQFLFNKTSNNMNQIAHVLNGAKLAGILKPSLCMDAVGRLEAIGKYLKSALNHVD
jgi:hypothetical protein